MRRKDLQRVLVGCVGLVGVIVGCSSDPSTVSTTPASTTASIESTTTIDSSTSSTVASEGIVNVWSGSPVDLTKLPLGNSLVSTTGAAVGGLFSCSEGRPNGAGAQVAGPWIDEAAGTWDATAKISVQGSVEWPMAKYSEEVVGATRSIASTGLPVGYVTGTFPIAANDPAFQYDRNPNRIGQFDVAYELPVTPTVAGTPGCLPPAAIAILRNGVVVFAPLDERNRDAVAYETQDECDGHPQQAGEYHYHDVPSCILAASTGSSTVVGFALDGYSIVVERDADGKLPTNADLDECHGRTSAVLLDGEIVETYHYSATYEFPYFIGCFHGTADF